MDKQGTRALSVLVVGFLIRVVAAIITTVTTLNPDSRADAVGFELAAEAIARGIMEGQPYKYLSTDIYIYQLWGSFLAPFWLLPGPSGFYARLANAFLGAFAIYNVYLIAQYYHSHQAGVISVLPMLFYPSFVAVQSTLLRESIVLFGITTAARLLMITSQDRSRYWTYTLALVALYVAYIQRLDNFGIYVVAIGSAVAVYAVYSGYVSRRSAIVSIILSIIAFVMALPLVRDGVEYLARTRVVRASGRAVYIPGIIPQTIPELVAFSWIGAAYFLFAPFPWMITTIPDLLVGLEGLVNIGFTVAGLWGVRYFLHKNPHATVGLFFGLLVAVVLYGVGTVNYGTGMRHRQMFLWVIFLFGGIGIAEHVSFKWSFKSANESKSLSR